MSDARKIAETVKPVLNGLHYREQISVMEINSVVLGLVTRSMQDDIGKEKARDFIISAMDNVWGKAPRRKRWKR